MIQECEYCFWGRPCYQCESCGRLFCYECAEVRDLCCPECGIHLVEMADLSDEEAEGFFGLDLLTDGDFFGDG